MINRTKLIAMLMGILVLLPSTKAATYTPTSPEHVVASWQVKNQRDPQDYVEALITQASLPGYASRNYGQAEATLKNLLEERPSDSHLLYLRARIEQYHHQFERAQLTLDELIALTPNHSAAWLLKANIYLVQNNIEQSIEACKRLLGQSSMLVSATCMLGAKAQHGRLDESYRQLVGVYALSDNPSPETDIWIVQILADMAWRTNRLSDAKQHINRLDLTQVPVSYLALWADIHLALNEHQVILDKLGPIVDAGPAYDDALLLRLALAEKNTSRASEIWRLHLDQRMAIRLQRGDEAHAADIARYFTDIQINPAKALKWAQINWRHSKLAEDKIILQRALELSQGSSNTSNEDTESAGVS